MPPLPLVVCGPSGVGKGTIIELVMKAHASLFGFSVSHTTRQPRPGEEDGVHYHFRPLEEVQKAVDSGEFLEHANVHGNIYGTSKASVAKVTDSGRCCILDIDVQGARQVRAALGNDAVFVFVKPPSMEELEARLRGRGTETEEQVKKRLGNAAGEIAAAEEALNGSPLFDHVVVNTNLDAASKSVETIALGAARGEPAAIPVVA
ncbi:guanylate kinase [Pycnococcus provasolii]